MSFLPPDRDTKRFPSTSPTLILSVSEEALDLTKEISGEFLIFSESIAITGEIKSPRIQASLYTPPHFFICSNSLYVSGEKGVGIDISGPDGTVDAINGGNGGDLQIYIENTSSETFDTHPYCRHLLLFDGDITNSVV